MKSIILLKKCCAIAILLMPMTACSLSSGPINGQVLDDQTGAPIPGAVAVVTWEGTWSGIVDSKSACYHVETAVADGQGKYQIRAWSLPWQIEDMLVSNKQKHFDAYKPGYVRSKKGIGKTVFLARFSGTKDEYFDNLESLRASNSCSSGGQSRKNLVRFYAPMLDEAKAMAETPEQKMFLANLSRSLKRLSD